MKIAYFDCFSGISGDMMLGALVDAGAPFEKLKDGLSKLDLEGYSITAYSVLKKGIRATKVDVVVDSRDLPGRPFKDLRDIVADSRLDASIKGRSLSIFRRIAEAEALVHDCPVEDVHFHEVGHIDTIVDIVGAVICLNLLGIEKVVSSPIDTGSGYVEMSHGKFPVPAPVTLELLKDARIYSSGIEKELTTPTGAAIITSIASSFSAMPEMRLAKAGYGAGGWDLSEKANVLRILIGEAEQLYDMDEVVLLETNIDDMNPQIYEYLIERLMQSGALDVYITPILMKKGRPANILSVLTTIGDMHEIRKLMFKETTTLGIRINRIARSVLKREIREIDTPYGRIRAKMSSDSNGIINIIPEYEDCKRIALDTGAPLKDIIELARKIANKNDPAQS